MKKIIKNVNFNSNISIGVFTGIIAITFYSMINIFSQSFDSLLINKYWPVVAATVFVTIKEFSAIIAYFLSGPKKTWTLIKNMWKNDRNIALWSSLAGVFGGAIGFSLTTAGGIYISSGMSSPFYSVEIIIVLIIVRILFKRKPNMIQLIGIVVIASSVILLPVLNSVLYSTKSSDNLWLGAGLIVLGVVCWSVETLIFDKVSERKNANISAMVQYKQLSSFLFLIIILFPFFSLVHGDGFTSSYKLLGTMFNENWKALLVAIASGFLLYFGRLFFFMSNKYVGGTTSNSIYALLPLIQIPLAAIANAIDPSVDYLGTIHHEYFWVLMFTLTVGIGIALYGQIKNDNAKL